MWGYDAGKIFALAQDLGWTWWHGYCPYSAKVIQPDSEKLFRWADTDYLTDQALKHGFEIYGGLSGHGALNEEDPPDWMRSSKLGMGGSSRGKGMRLVDPAKYAAYVKAVVEHYKGRVNMWEIWNEPGVKMRIEEYMPLQEAAYKAAKEANPDSRIYGLCGTWDVGGDTYGWVKSGIALGAANSMDAVTIHGYHVPSRDYVEQVRRLVRQGTGRDMEILDSESGAGLVTLYDGHFTGLAFPGMLNSPLKKASWMANLQLSVLAHGGSRQSWFNMTAYMGGLARHDFSLLEYDGAPSMAFIANNVLIDRLSGGDFVKTIELGGGVVIYVFDVKGKGMAMLWADDKPQILEIPISSDAIRLENLGGQKCEPKSDGGRVLLSLTENLYYLTLKDGNGMQLANLLQSAVVQGLDSVIIDRVGMTGSNELSIRLRGATGNPSAGTLELMRLPKEWEVESASIAYEPIPLGAKRTVHIPLRGDLQQDTESALKIGLGSDSGIVSQTSDLKRWTTQKRNQTVTIDGDLQEWRTVPIRKISDWAGISLQWDAAGLWIAAQVQDTTPRSYQESPGLEAWQSDSIEIFLSASPKDSFENNVYGPGDCQIILSIRGAGKSKDSVVANGNPSGINVALNSNSIKLVSKRSPKGYTAEAFIPWHNLPTSFFPKENEIVGFDISIRDMDEAGQQLHHLIWAGDKDNHTSTEHFGTLILGK